MQIIEATIFGVRSVVRLIETNNGRPSFRLFPMIHIADQSFYDEIAERLEECDLILCEGVKSPTNSWLTASYRYAADSPRLGLAVQSSMPLDPLNDRMIHADVDGSDFEKKWQKLPLYLRLLLPVFAPVFGYWLRHFGSRSFIASAMGLNLRKSRAESLMDEDLVEVQEVLLGWRDRHLISVIERERAKPENQGACIGIVYGAMHMRAVLRHLLSDRSYRITKSEWVTVFKY